MSKLNEIAKVVMPTVEFTSYEDLFVRKSRVSCQINGVVKASNLYRFNTWMNTFAAKKYFYYCELGNIFLRLAIDGRYALRVVGSNRNPAFKMIETSLLELECEGSCEVCLPLSIKEYEGVYFEIVEHLDAPIEFKAAAWCTDVAPQRENKLAIVTCTFKREEYIYKNVEKFKAFIASNDELKESLKLIVVDNGRSLDIESISDESVKVIPNMNAGGAGGFTRGLMDVVEQEAGFTRVLFMDDDVEISTEAFYRTLLLSNYLKEEFKTSFINGAMLDLYKKNTFVENLAIQQGLWVRNFATSLNAYKYKNTLAANDIPADVFNDSNAKVDSAWWYSCFDLSIVAEKGLPLPLFFRGDDVEWGWRSFGEHHISMNGINVWHAPFSWRVSAVADCYYLPRNMFFLNAIYTADFKSAFRRYFINMFKRVYRTYDYSRLAVLIKAMEDILRGSEVYREDPEAQFKSITELSKQFVQLEKVSDEELKRVGNYEPKVKSWRKILYKLTNKGAFAPRFLFKKRAVSMDLAPDYSSFIMVKQVRVYNLFTRMCDVRDYDAKKLALYKKQFYSLLDKVYCNYDALKEELEAAHKEFSTVDFWREYLKLNK